MADAHFTRFAAIDWSGAKGKRHKGIAIAVAEAGQAAPRLVRPDHVWSRREALEWLLDAAGEAPTLFGFDFSFAPPIAERGEYLPGEPGIPSTAREFWSYVDARCEDEDLGAASFLEQVHRRHFYFGIADGEKARFVRFRQCDARLNLQGGRKTASAYDAIGAAQVAKGSFAGMRLLHHVGRGVAVWPFDPVPDEGATIVEIYTAIAARAAGLPKGRSKIRDAAALNAALEALGSEPHAPLTRYDDHATDAILTAAWLRANAARDELWAPDAMTPTVARTEGWTFGVT
jgi:hypothetical protein